MSRAAVGRHRTHCVCNLWWGHSAEHQHVTATNSHKWGSFLSDCCGYTPKCQKSKIEEALCTFRCFKKNCYMSDHLYGLLVL